MTVRPGFYESELLRRIDPHGRTLGRLFADEVAGPLAAEFYIGVPDHVRDERIATIHAFKPVEMLLHLDKMPTRLLINMLNPRGTMSRAMRSMSFLMEPGAFNRREVRAAELPLVNGTGQIRAIARIYGALATGGTELGIGPTTLRLLEEPGTDPVRGLRDAVVQMNTRFLLGYLKPFPGFEFGSSDRAYGTPGGRGSLGFVDPDARVGYGYGMNRLGFTTRSIRGNSPSGPPSMRASGRDHRRPGEGWPATSVACRVLHSPQINQTDRSAHGRQLPGRDRLRRTGW